MIRKLVKKMYHAYETFVRNHKKTALIAVFFVAIALVWNNVQPQLANAANEATVGGAAAGTGTGTGAAAGAPPSSPGPGAVTAPVGGATADASAGIASGSFWLDLFSKILLAIARLFLSLTLFILTFIVQVAGYNGFLNASAVNVGWVMVRDITNMGFVVILLVIAFGTILGVEHYEWKKMLVKMVIAAVVVNFSRTICGLMIDVAQVVMITFVNGIAATAGGNLIRMFNLDSIRDLSVSADPKSFDSSNYFIASIGAVFFSAMVMSVLAVFMVMLVARMIVLWVLIVLSPLAFVLSVLPQTEGYAKQWWSEFGKNVITGPVLMFFVWLAFVTAGNGKIYDQISQPENNAITKNAGATDESELLNGNTSGIGAALEWNNMANFIIAIGMLMVGARAASELGGVGGSWAGEALDFGKKVGMYASGAMAARYAAGKVGEGAAAAGKYALRPIERMGETAQKYAKIQFTKMGISNDKKAKSLEDAADAQNDAASAKKVLGKLEGKRAAGILTADETKKYDEAQEKLTKAEKSFKEAKKGAGVLGVLAGTRLTAVVGAGFVESRARAEKRLEDLDKAAHQLEVVHDKNFSTSKSWQSKLKLTTEVQEHAAMAMSKAKHDEKFTKRSIEMMGDHTGKFDLFHDNEKNTFKAQANAEKQGETLKQEQTKVKDEVGFFKTQMEAQKEAIATEQLEKRTQAKAARATSQPLLANLLEQQADSLPFEKTQEGLLKAKLNSNERANVAKALSVQLGQINVELQNPGLSATDRRDKELLRNTLMAQKTALTASSSSMTAYDAQQDMRKSLEAANWGSEEWTEKNSKRRFLTSLVGYKVEAGKEAEADAQLKVALGSGYDAAMRQFGTNAKNQTAQGNRDYAIFDEEEGKDSAGGLTGVTKYVITKKDGTALEKQINDTLEGWLKGGDLNVGKMKQGLGDRLVDPVNNIDKIVKISGDEIKLNARFLNGATSQSISRLEGGLLGDLDNMDTTTVPVGDIKELLTEFAKNVSDKKAFESLVGSKLKNLVKKVDDDTFIKQLALQANDANWKKT